MIDYKGNQFSKTKANL